MLLIQWERKRVSDKEVGKDICANRVVNCCLSCLGGKVDDIETDAEVVPITVETNACTCVNSLCNVSFAGVVHGNRHMPK